MMWVPARFVIRNDDFYAIGTGLFEILSVYPGSNVMWLSSTIVFGLNPF